MIDAESRNHLVTAKIHNWRKHGTEVKLPRSSQLTTITPRPQWGFTQELQKVFRTSRALQVFSASLRVRVDSRMRTQSTKMYPRGRPLLSKNILYIFGKYFWYLPKTYEDYQAWRFYIKAGMHLSQVTLWSAVATLSLHIQAKHLSVAWLYILCWQTSEQIRAGYVKNVKLLMVTTKYY